MSEIPKYSQIEFERRWLVNPQAISELSLISGKSIQDRYLSCGRLRLRCISEHGRQSYKLCKKYGSIGVGAEPITNIYLSQDEYMALLKLDGHDIQKLRVPFQHGKHRFSVDLYEGRLLRLAICEIEAPNVEELNSISKPDFCLQEVTNNPMYSGGAISELPISEIQKILPRSSSRL